MALILLQKVSKGSAGSGVRRMSSVSLWDKVPMGPADPILGLNEAFRKDTHPQKVLLGAGAYRTDEGKPLVLRSVKTAEAAITAAGLNKEYAPIHGLQEFIDLAMEFAYGPNSSPLSENRVAGVQTLSGTGACRLVGEFYSKFLGKDHPIYLPNPTWGNHIPIMKNAGMDVRKYAYYQPKTRGLDFEGLIKDIRSAPKKSVFLLHACAHNPTGVDPTLEQWREISDEIKKNEIIPFFDCAYQGFASGDADRDAAAVRQFVKDGHNIALAQSFAKNFGLYGERAGVLSFVCKDKDEAKRVLSQLKIIIRPMYSNPPIHGAHIVKTILADKDLRAEWYRECKNMADRIIEMRSLLRKTLEGLGSKHSWKHITDQIGMFCFTGLTPQQVDRIRDEFHVYLTQDGRVSMAGVNSHNVEYVAQSIYKVTQ